jgi:hypothetical protein
VADEAEVLWSKLSYRITKLMLSVQVDVEAVISTALQPAEGWINSPEGVPVLPRARGALAVRIDTRGVGRSSVLDLWADPYDWAALQRSSVEEGRKLKDFRYRGYRFVDKGVFCRTRYPRAGQPGRPSSEWSEVDEEFLRFPEGVPGRFVDASTLFWIVSTLNPTDPEAHAEIDVWLRRGLFRLEIRARELTQISANYESIDAVGEQVVRGVVPVRRFTISGEPLHVNSGLKNFRFAGLSGEIEVFLDVRSRVPVQISGDLRPLGRGHLKLKQVRFNDR